MHASHPNRNGTYRQAPRICILKFNQSFCQRHFTNMYNFYLVKRESIRQFMKSGSRIKKIVDIDYLMPFRSGQYLIKDKWKIL